MIKNCAWINCKYNSFTVSESMKRAIYNGHVEITGNGKCNCKEDISLLIEETDEEYLICDNYIDGAKFDL